VRRSSQWRGKHRLDRAMPNLQLTVAAVTPPAEHAARRPAGAADAAAADAGVGDIKDHTKVLPFFQHFL